MRRRRVFDLLKRHDVGVQFRQLARDRRVVGAGPADAALAVAVLEMLQVPAGDAQLAGYACLRRQDQREDKGNRKHGNSHGRLPDCPPKHPAFRSLRGMCPHLSAQVYLDLNSAMVARTPFIQPVPRSHPDPFVKPARGDGIVELPVGLGRRALLRAVVGGDVPREVLLVEQPSLKPPV